MREESSRRAILQLFETAGDDALRQSLSEQLVPLLREMPTMERALDPFVRFVSNTRFPVNFLVFLDRDRDALPTLLQILSIDSKAVEWLVADPDSFDWLRLSAGQAVDSEHIKDTLLNEIHYLDEETQILSSLNRFRKRETLRVICAVFLHDMQLSIALQQLSWIADAGIAATWSVACSERLQENRRRLQLGAKNDFTDAVCWMGFSDFGGLELELHGRLGLHVLVDHGSIDHPNERFVLDELQRTIDRTIDLLIHPQGLHYAVTFPFEDATKRDDAMHVTAEEHLHWIQSLENQGRMWERLSLIKARYVAGNPVLAHRLLQELPSLAYRKYLTRADIAGIAAIKRKFDRDEIRWDGAMSPDQVTIDVLRGWKREVEFLIQFLQLMYGGELVAIRAASTLPAIDGLWMSGCLTEQERSILISAYERYCQVIFYRQARDPLGDSAIGVVGNNDLVPSAAECIASSERVKQIRDHLRSEVFTDEDQVGEEADLILDPHPNPGWTDRLLAKYGFRHTREAYHYLRELSEEEVVMLSTQRCRHFLSIIASKLLTKISETPDPDLTLQNLAVSCRSLGGKGVLWELFSAHEPSFDLYIRLCGASPYLIGILTSNPGMIDELLDSLMLNRLPNEQQLGYMLHELCRGAEDIEPIVYSFKNAGHLSVGARDILGKESISDTHRALSNIAEVCFQQIVNAQYTRLISRFGVPMNKEGDPCQFAVLAFGKLGAREPNYHSDIELMVIFDAHGMTKPLVSNRHHEPISAEFFFHQLAQKIAQTANRIGRSGRLYETKNWTCSFDPNAMLAWQIDDFKNFLIATPNQAQVRQQLCNARAFIGDPSFMKRVHHALRDIAIQRAWSPLDQKSALEFRQNLEKSATPRNLKRGVGGTVDVEFIAQTMILQNVAKNESLFVPGTLDQIEQLRASGYIRPEDADQLHEGYNYLRGVESGLRLLNTQARHDLPGPGPELERLAYVLQIESGAILESQCDHFRAQNRALYTKYMQLSDPKI